MHNVQEFDVVIIGGGFYGCSVALLMKEFFSSVLIIEKESDLMTRASLVNQARVHNGYHYPRSLITAYRSYINFPRFTKEFEGCIVDDFVKLYAIAKNGSKVNSFQFNQMFRGIGAPIDQAPLKYKQLFNKDLIEDIFFVKEFAFDAFILKEIMKQKLEDEDIHVWYNKEVKSVTKGEFGNLNIAIVGDQRISSQYVFNCTYSQINKLLQNSSLPLLPMKHELTEMALIEMPDELKKVGITVMDGPFFSTMPYPTKKLHSLSHVRYTPHFSWTDRDNFGDGHLYLKNTIIKSNYLYMIKDVQRYIPAIKDAKYKESIYEIKTVLLQNENDDGRPILFRKSDGVNSLYNIMGGKIDNIYDIIERIKEVNFTLPENFVIAGDIIK